MNRAPRIHRIRRSQHLGYGFIAGHERPTMVKIVEPNGPSFRRLLPGDVIMAVNGIDVEDAPREQIIKMIQLSQEEVEIKVRQPTYEEILRVKNLAEPKTYLQYKCDLKLPVASERQQMASPHVNYMSMNRLVTPTTQQHSQPPLVASENPNASQVEGSSSNNSAPDHSNEDATVKPSRLFDGSSTLGKNANHKNYGRHSPLPQRCKSSLSGTQEGKLGKKSGDTDSDQPMLKRSNTMRPIRPPAKVMEIFEVVIRIFFEDGHTRVLKYSQDTTVGTILETLNSRLVGDSPHSEQIKRSFGLTLTVNSEDSSGDQQKLYILDENDSIMKIRQLPYAPKLRLLYRMINPPQDVSKLYSQDKVVFEYLYKQSCNDLKLERFFPRLDMNTALKLGALHLVEYVYSNYPKAHGNSREPKTYLKLVKKTPGLEYFVPNSMVEGTTDKKGRKNVNYKRLKSKMFERLKLNFEEFDFEPPQVRSTTNLHKFTSTSFHELSLPEFQSSPSDYVKLLFLTYLSQLPCYGASKRPVRSSTSPIDRCSLADCSSSLESVPRTSESSPLLKQDPNQPASDSQLNRSIQHVGSGTISRLAQMNSVRTLSSQLPNGFVSQTNDKEDKAQTPSIESISSITFNMQHSPSPQPTSLYPHMSQHSGSYTSEPQPRSRMIEPSPMPRQQLHIMRARDCNSIEKIYSQRYKRAKPIDEFLKNAILLPPPPASAILFGGFTSNKMTLAPLTPILTDRDLEGLKVPPPPPSPTSRVSHRHSSNRRLKRNKQIMSKNQVQQADKEDQQSKLF